jgi:hypothetical protein
LHHDKEEEIYSLLLRQGVDYFKEVIEKTPDKKVLILPLKPGTYNLNEYTIKNKTLTLKGREGVNIIGSINIEDSKVTFENIQFENVSADRSKVVFNNCKGKGIYGTASQITINGSEIHGNKGNGICVKENSTLKIKDSRVYENGTKGQSYHQIWVENSEADISTSLVYNSKGGTGIWGKASQITINGSEIHGNGGRGIEVVENSTLEIKDSRVYENGTAKQFYPQIGVAHSKADISTSLVYDSKGGTGIYGKASQITINGSEIHGNGGRGIEVVENSTLEIKDSKVYENFIGIYGTASQVTINNSEIHGNEVRGIEVVENSTLEIKDSKVYENFIGIYGTASQVTINNSEVYGHDSNGIFIFNSTLSMKGSQVYKNGAGISQIDIYGKCQVTIRDTHVYNSKGDYGIWIEKSGSKVELINVKTWGNKYGLKCNQYGTSVLIKKL